MSQQNVDYATMEPDYAKHLQDFAAAYPIAPPSDFFALRSLLDDAIIPLIKKISTPSLPKESEYTVHDHKVPVEGGEILVRSLTPNHEGDASDEKKTYPLFVWYHGGGWSAGNIEMDDTHMRRLCVDLQISILNVQYRLAPEFPFPTGINDAYAALKWAAENASQFSSSPSKGFIVGGLSAGGNFTAVLSRRARDDPFFEGRQLTGQLLQVPVIIHPSAYPEQYKAELNSFEQLKEAPFLTKTFMELYDSVLKPNFTDPDFSPLLASSHSNLPPAFIQVAGGDLLRDEGILYSKVLEKAGVTTKLTVYPGLHHAAHLWIEGPEVCKKFWKDFSDGLLWLISLSKKGE